MHVSKSFKNVLILSFYILIFIMILFLWYQFYAVKPLIAAFEGYTIAPGGGGPGDHLTLTPIIPSLNIVRIPGTSLRFGPYDRNRVIVNVTARIMLASFEDTYVKITLTVGDVEIFLGRGMFREIYVIIH